MVIALPCTYFYIAIISVRTHFQKPVYGILAIPAIDLVWPLLPVLPLCSMSNSAQEFVANLRALQLRLVQLERAAPAASGAAIVDPIAASAFATLVNRLGPWSLEVQAYLQRQVLVLERVAT